METKVIRKLPELNKQQEWACEGGCDFIKPKHFESIFSESVGLGGGLIERKSEFYYTCQKGHKLEVWDNDKADMVVLGDEYYQEEAEKIVQTDSIQGSIDLLYNEMDSLKNSIVEEGFLDNEQAELIENLITKAIQFGALTERRDMQSVEAVPCETNVDTGTVQ